LVDAGVKCSDFTAWRALERNQPEPLSTTRFGFEGFGDIQTFATANSSYLHGPLPRSKARRVRRIELVATAYPLAWHRVAVRTIFGG